MHATHKEGTLSTGTSLSPIVSQPTPGLRTDRGYLFRVMLIDGGFAPLMFLVCPSLPLPQACVGKRGLRGEGSLGPALPPSAPCPLCHWRKFEGGSGEATPPPSTPAVWTPSQASPPYPLTTGSPSLCGVPDDGVEARVGAGRRLVAAVQARRPRRVPTVNTNAAAGEVVGISLSQPESV